tara:strand:- start:806 stop:1402 length:597 start_codon:yes stop_codon:yes gene_type:complete
MKKTTASNPLKFFNDSKVARNKSFSKSLPKAQNGIEYKGSELAKEYAKAPMVGAEPEWSYLEGQRVKSAGPVTNPYINAYKEGPYNKSNTIYRDPSTGKQTGAANSNVMNDPRFSGAMEKTNEFYNKEKNAGTLYNNKGFSARMSKSEPPKGSINVVNTNKKNGGATKAAKFAALAPPYNKATFADKIVGAKKNAKKK